jgi:hypothetical protein
MKIKRKRAELTLFAKFDHGPDRGIVWLAGIDPTVHSRPNFAQHHP